MISSKEPKKHNSNNSRPSKGVRHIKPIRHIMKFPLIQEGLDIFSRNVQVKMKGLKSYNGDNKYESDEDICKNIIEACYDKKRGYFRASYGNYKIFYARDFGWCVQALLNLGYRTEVEDTLRRAMNIYRNCNMITVAISRREVPFNFPKVYSPDSVAYMYRSLRILKSQKLLLEYRQFLNEQLKVFESEVIDTDGMLKSRPFSGMRDHIKATNLCYDMTMACMLCDEVDKINILMGKDFIKNVLKKYDLKKKLVKHYWNGQYFYDGLHTKYCSGHANTYPYFLNVITDKKMLQSSIKSIQKNNLDKPMPLQYGILPDTKFLWFDVFVHDWEKETVWAMLGLAYIDIVSRFDKKLAKAYLEQYHRLILKYQCLIEVYYTHDSDCEPYKSIFFSSDDSMIWASMYLDLKNKLKNIEYL